MSRVDDLSFLYTVHIIIVITSFYIAFFTIKGCLKALPKLLHLVTGPFDSFLKPSQPPGSIQPV